MFRLSDLFTTSLYDVCTPLSAASYLTRREGHLPLHIYQLCHRLINHINSISGEDSERRRRWLSASVIALIMSLSDGGNSPAVNANRFLAQIEPYDSDMTLRQEILSFGFHDDEQSQIPWYSEEGEGERLLVFWICKSNQKNLVRQDLILTVVQKVNLIN